MLAVPPEFLYPTHSITLNPRYDNTTFFITCEALGKPDVEIMLYKNDMRLNETDFKRYSYSFELDIKMYGLTHGYGARFEWNLDNIGDTCESVEYYDSMFYSCKATNVGTDYQETSSVIFAIETNCKCSLETKRIPSLFALISYVLISLDRSVCSEYK